MFQPHPDNKHNSLRRGKRIPAAHVSYCFHNSGFGMVIMQKTAWKEIHSQYDRYSEVVQKRKWYAEAES